MTTPYLSVYDLHTLKCRLVEYGRTASQSQEEGSRELICTLVNGFISRNRASAERLTEEVWSHRLKQSEGRCAELALKLAKYEDKVGVGNTLPSTTERRVTPPIAPVETLGQTLAKAISQLEVSEPPKYLVHLNYSDGSYGSVIVRAFDVWEAEKKGIAALAQYSAPEVKITSVHVSKK